MVLKLKTITLGCKVNQYETEFVREGLASIGYQDAGHDQAADLCVVNTCTVTREAESKSRQMIRRLARENPGTRIIVMGCYATRAPDEVRQLPAVAEAVTDKRELPALLTRLGMEEAPRGISQFAGRQRAFLKVQDGCMLRCSYCIIPKVRPHVSSRAVPEILDEARRLIDNGYRELVLTGVHLGHYGVEQNRSQKKSQWLRLSYLVHQLAELPGDFRIRLSSLEATEVTHELIATVKAFPDKICPHLHICLQSGSDRILRKMRRRWSTRLFLDRCTLVRQSITLPALTTDAIVGFPSETEDDFEETCRVIRDVGFSKVHIFPFSARVGTAAARMPGQLSKVVKNQRKRQLAAVERELRDNYFRTLLGRRMQVLVESRSEKGGRNATGTSARYAPVTLTSCAASPGELIDCVPYAYDGTHLLAAPTPKRSSTHDGPTFLRRQ